MIFIWITGKLINNNQEHSLTGLLQIDDQEYIARLGLQVTGDAATHAEYKPVLEYSGPGPDGKASKGSSEGQQVFLDGKIHHYIRFEICFIYLQAL